MRVLAIPDLHEPFSHKDSLAFVKEVINTWEPDKIVLLGDEVDHHAYSRYLHDPDGLGPREEFELAKKKLNGWYKLLSKFEKVYVCHSNHTTRPFKKAASVGLPSLFMKSIKEVLEAPKSWEWSDAWKIDGVNYIHGEGFSGRLGAVNAASSYGTPVVMGHLHSHAGVQYSSSFGSNLWGVNSGCLIDSKKYAFSYAKFSRHKPVLGVTLVDDGIFPVFIPLSYYKKNN